MLGPQGTRLSAWGRAIPALGIRSQHQPLRQPRDHLVDGHPEPVSHPSPPGHLHTPYFLNRRPHEGRKTFSHFLAHPRLRRMKGSVQGHTSQWLGPDSGDGNDGGNHGDLTSSRFSWHKRVPPTSGASLKQRHPSPTHMPGLLRLPEMALFGLKLSEPISQIQVLQRGNTQRSANPLLIFSMRDWLGQGHRVKGSQWGQG